MVFGGRVDACVMAPKTFAHGWATLAAMDRPRDHGGIVVERTDDWMLGQELERLLSVGLPSDQLSQRSEAIAPVRKGRVAGLFQFRARMLLGE